jgi:hypothetical protein
MDLAVRAMSGSAAVGAIQAIKIQGVSCGARTTALFHQIRSRCGGPHAIAQMRETSLAHRQQGGSSEMLRRHLPLRNSSPARHASRESASSIGIVAFLTFHLRGRTRPELGRCCPKGEKNHGHIGPGTGLEISSPTYMPAQTLQISRSHSESL